MAAVLLTFLLIALHQTGGDRIEGVLQPVRETNRSGTATLERIVGGIPAAAGQFPYAVSVRLTVKSQ